MCENSVQPLPLLLLQFTLQQTGDKRQNCYKLKISLSGLLQQDYNRFREL